MRYLLITLFLVATADAETINLVSNNNERIEYYLSENGETVEQGSYRIEAISATVAKLSFTGYTSSVPNEASLPTSRIASDWKKEQNRDGGSDLATFDDKTRAAVEALYLWVNDMAPVGKKKTPAEFKRAIKDQLP